MIKCIKCGEVSAIAKAGIIRGNNVIVAVFATIISPHRRAKKTQSNFHRRHPATIIDIARELQISKSTVSRALHGHTDINEATKSRLDVARKLEYSLIFLPTVWQKIKA